MTSTKYCVGIDLGTTHCAVARVSIDTDEAGSPSVCPITQLVGRDSLHAASLLPSFVYFPHQSEPRQSLPWQEELESIIGEYARLRAAETPGRVVASAKSWLSHPSVDRHAPVLPLSAPEDVEQISPVEATFRILDHLAEAFSHEQGCALADQEVILTVPASFDAAARECTVEAALAAGLQAITLLEEPQAAFYAWLDSQGESWRRELSVGDVVLVVDAGGGTIDFAAIHLQEEQGALSPRRIAVGQHILLGGDNMDLALAHLVKQKLESGGTTLDAWQMAGLTHAVRAAKENLLADNAPATASVVVPSRGSQLLGSSIRSELTREEVQKSLVDGFFPVVDWTVSPRRRPRTGLRQRGLPYADDPAVTAHLAAFLRQHSTALSDGHEILSPTHVLFNGGVFRSSLLRNRVMESLNAWMMATGAKAAEVLSNPDFDLAVARGASYYGLARRGRGVRVRGGAAQAFYVGIESPAPAVPGMDPPVAALCVAPFGMEEGTRVVVDAAELTVVVGEAVTFRFFGSTVRRDDQVGAMIESPERQLNELSPIVLTLPPDNREPGDWVTVTLEACLTEIGTLELFARPEEPLSEDEFWKVELSVRVAEDDN